jgi:hypothetical protein
MKSHAREQLWVGSGLIAVGGIATWLQVENGVEPIQAFVRGKRIEAAAKTA